MKEAPAPAVANRRRAGLVASPSTVTSRERATWGFSLSLSLGP